MKKLLAILLSVLLLVGTLPMAAFAEMGGDFPWTDENETTLVEEIIARDGMIDGIWMPWFNPNSSGHNLTGNELMAELYNSSSSNNWARVEMDYYGADKIYREIYNLKAMGYNMLAYGGSIYGEGVIFDESGDVLGIKEEYLTNARRFLDMCREVGMPVMWNVYFHSSSAPQYHGIDGWKIICQMLGNRTVADHYAERFVRPLCAMLAEYPDVVALVSIADEPENEINDSAQGNHFDNRPMYGVNQDDMVYFMQGINEVVREELPGVPRTVASNAGNKTIYRDFDLDLMGHNQYTDGSTFKSVASMITDADPILTEYNIGSATYTDDAYADKLIEFRQWMMDNGYKGGFQWCWMPQGYGRSGSNSHYLQRVASDNTSFRKTVSLLRYFIDEYRAEYRGETITLDAPVVYANAGDGKVVFIPSKRATKITIQRSDDGGSTWTNLVTNVDQANYVDAYLVGRYTDTTSRPSSGYCYRIIATDGTNTVTSAPNDPAGTDATFKKTYTAPSYSVGSLYEKTTLTKAESEADTTKLTSFGVLNNRPLTADSNLLTNGSFENTSGGQWNSSSFLNSYISVAADSTAPEGAKSLRFDTTGTDTAAFYTFTVTGLQANTEYVFSTWIKGAHLSAANAGTASVGVIDPDTGKFMIYYEYYRDYARASRETQQIYPTAWDNQWHLRSVAFTTGDNTTATIALYGAGSVMYLDDMAVYEPSAGVKYDNGSNSKALTSTAYNPASGATNAVADPGVNDVSYWNTGAGYKQGFVNAASGALKYTASATPTGLCYTKWIDVKPGTDYHVSYTVNVTSAGSGRVAILDDAMQLPNENLGQSFSSTGTKTVTGRISTGQYDQLGLCVVDMGGAATIDNIYLYEGDASVVIPTTPSFDGYITNGDFEVGSITGWENVWGSNTVEIVDGRDGSLFAVKGTAGGSYTQVRQKIIVEPNTDYVIEAWAKDVNGTTLIVKDSTDSNLKQTALQGSGSTWTKTVLEFNSGSHEFVYLGFMGSSAGKTWTVDDVTMYKKPTESNDGYLVNGNFETGVSNPWINVWGSNTITIVEGHDSNYGMQVNAGLYNVVRQQVTVEPNTDYVITVWSKNSVNGVLLVKDSADSKNIVNKALNTSSTWTEMTVEFNSGDNEFVYVGFMGGAANSSYIVDDVVMTKKAEPEPTYGVVNGGFEDGKDSWTFGSGTSAIVTDAHSGTNALQLTNPAKWGAAAQQTFDVEANTDYTITWWYKATSGTGTFNLYVMNDSSANMTKVSGQNWMNNYTGAWTKGTYEVNTGSSTKMTLKFSTETSNPGTILIDDVVVVKSDDAVCDHTYTSVVTKVPTCGATGVRTYTCSLCGDSYTETIAATGNHTYDNTCDADCNVCGATRTVTHTYSGACDNYCNLCGAKKTGISIGVSHTYDNACDADCNVCGEIRSVSGHEYTSAVTKNPTCDETGVRTYTCSACGNSYTETIAALGHDYKGVVTAPDCENGGYTTYTCATCGDSYVADETDALGHDYKGVVTAPDCENGGYTTYTCATCGDSYVADETDALGHSYKAVVTAPDCVNGGYTTHTCTVCGDSYKDNYTEAAGHNYVGVETKAPTCTEAGVMTYTCSGCGDSYTEAISALGHTAGAEADCVNDQVCTVCGEVLKAALGHSYKAEVTAPDCVNGGYTTHTCTVCGDSYKDNYTEATGHNYVGVETKAPTCGATGVMTYTCSACGDSYTEIIPATGAHSYAHDFDVDCDVCGAIREVSLPITFGGNSVSEDVSGLAFRFDVEVDGMTVNGTTAVYAGATVNGYKLISMGALLSNGVSEANIPAVYLCDLTDTAASYAVRVIKIPANKYDVEITAIPYFVVEINGEATTIYGETQTSTYNAAALSAPVV